MSEEGSSSKCYSLAMTDENQSEESSRKSTMASLKCRKPQRKTIYIILGLLLVLAVFLTVMVTQLRLKGDDCPDGVNCDWKAVSSSEYLKDERCQDLCNTKSCLKAAIYSMKRIDESQDPCNDFYKFACGAYTKATRASSASLVDKKDSSMKELHRSFILDIRDVLENIPENGTGVKGSALRFVKTFYRNCLHGNSADFESQTTNFLHELFSSDGKLPWPLVNKDLQSSANKKFESSLAFLSSISSNPFFEIQLIHRPRSKWLIEVEIPNIRNLHQMYTGLKNQDNRKNVYMKTISYILEIMDVDNTTRDRTFNDAIALEKKVVEDGTYADQNIRTASDDEDELYTCDKMPVGLRALNWCNFVTRFLPLMGISPSVQVHIRINSMAYLKALNNIIERTLSRDLINYLNIKFLMKFQQYLTERFQYYHYLDDITFRKLPIYASASSHWQKCVLLTAENLWPALHEQFLDSKFNDEKREKVEEMVSLMNSTMKSVIKEFPWLDKRNKRLLTEEFNQGQTLLTMEAVVPPQEELDEIFSMMTSEERPLIEDVLDLMKLKNKMSFSSKINAIIFKTAEPFFADNTIHDQPMNHMYGPIYYRFPILDFGRPKYLDYSTLGQIIMFPMTRILRILTHLTEYDNPTDAVIQRNQCIRKEFLQFGDEEENDTDTDTEYNDLFDALTLQTTFKAYEKSMKNEGEEEGLPGLPLSNKQLFFIFYSQLHCESGTPQNFHNYIKESITPADVRVNGALSQSADFAKAFRCSEGSPMNPSNKCCLMPSKEKEDCV